MPGFSSPISDVPTIIALGAAALVAAGIATIIGTRWALRRVNEATAAPPASQPYHADVDRVLDAMVRPRFASHGADRAGILRRTP